MSDNPNALPIMEYSVIMTISKRNVDDTSLSSASMTGAIAATAEPPQMPVPADLQDPADRLHTGFCLYHRHSRIADHCSCFGNRFGSCCKIGHLCFS